MSAVCNKVVVFSHNTLEQLALAQDRRVGLRHANKAHLNYGRMTCDDGPPNLRGAQSFCGFLRNPTFSKVLNASTVGHLIPPFIDDSLVEVNPETEICAAASNVCDELRFHTEVNSWDIFTCQLGRKRGGWLSLDLSRSKLRPKITS